MRLSELAGKEIVTLQEGRRLGLTDECDILFSSDTGQIAALVLPSRSALFRLLRATVVHSIPWHAIKTIGQDIIIVEEAPQQLTSSSTFARHT